MNNNLTHTKGFRSNPYNRNTSSSSSPSSTSTRSYFNSSEIGDSDDEFSDSEDRWFPIFERKTPQTAKVMTVKCSDRNIKGSELIRVVHFLVELAHFYLFRCYIYGYGFIDPDREINGLSLFNVSPDKVGLKICDVTHWILSLGGWKGMHPKTEIQNFVPDYSDKDSSYSARCNRRNQAYITESELYFQDCLNRLSPRKKFIEVKIYENTIFSIENNRIHLPDEFTIGEGVVTKHRRPNEVTGQWEFGTKTDLSYSQINRTIGYIIMICKINDLTIARMQLKCLKGIYNFNSELEHISETVKKQIITFLHYLNALMFGIEASGLNSGLVTSLMTLDLIKDGKLTYQKAFGANNDGGAYPFATYGDNSGTYNARVPLIEGEVSMKKYRSNSSLSPIACKEAIMIKQWLKFKQVINKDQPREQQLKIIRMAIDALLYEHLVLDEERI